ncbi:MAG: hypothetical protein WBC44_15210 [Planctomycetaceae bacterium]
MKPKRIAELRAKQSRGPVPVLCGQDLADLLDTADREAKLREAVEEVLQVIHRGDVGKSDVFMHLDKALESKGTPAP